MTHMQQKFTHNRTAKYSQRLSSKIGVLKKEKVTFSSAFSILTASDMTVGRFSTDQSVCVVGQTFIMLSNV